MNEIHIKYSSYVFWTSEFIFFFLVICVCRFINYCIEKEGYTGYNISNLEGTEEVVERLIALNIHEEITGKRWP